MFFSPLENLPKSWTGFFYQGVFDLIRLIPWKSLLPPFKEMVVNLLLDDDKPYVIKNGETRKPTKCTWKKERKSSKHQLSGISITCFCSLIRSQVAGGLMWETGDPKAHCYRVFHPSVGGSSRWFLGLLVSGSPSGPIVADQEVLWQGVVADHFPTTRRFWGKVMVMGMIMEEPGAGYFL